MVLTYELRESAENGNIAAIQDWFSTGTRDPDERDEYGRTLLTSATAGGHIETMRVILAHGASVDAFNNGFARVYTALHGAADYGHHAIAVLLLDHGAQVDTRDNVDWTPLICAAFNGQCDLIRLFLHHGADFDAHEDNGETAETLARHQKNLEVAALLADVRRAGSWRGYVRYPRFRLLMLRIVAEQGRAETKDDLLVRLFPAGRRRRRVLRRPHEEYRAQKGGLIPRGIFMHIVGYWRSSRDYLGPTAP